MVAVFLNHIFNRSVIIIFLCNFIGVFSVFKYPIARENLGRQKSGTGKLFHKNNV